MKIDDIASLANVSKSAVSLAINGKPGVSAETRERILEIVKEYNYVPLRKVKNRSTKNKTIRFIACKSPNLITDQYQDLPFFNELIGFLSSEINNYPYNLVISTLDENNILKGLNELEEEHQSEGIIFLGTNLSKEQISPIQNLYKNLVVLDTHHPEVNTNFVSINNFHGGYLAAEYIIENGHKKIGYVMGSPTITNFIERKDGFFRKLEEASLTIPKEFTFHLPSMNLSDGDAIRHEFELLEDYPSAIFCENDYMAISLTRLLKELGIKIPEEISIIGFDDISESRVITPELTTLQVNKREMAIQTLDVLDKIINHKTETKHIQINTTLIVRASSLKFE